MTDAEERPAAGGKKTKLEESIAAAEKRLKQLKTRKQRAEARQRSIAMRTKRSLELRRQILVGSVVLAKVGRGEFAESQLRQWLDEVLTNKGDRALFELSTD